MTDAQLPMRPKEAGTWKDQVAKDTSTITKRGYRAVGLSMGVFFLWAMAFPISGAVIANGKVISAGQNKLLQHPRGGVVQEIHAQDGSFLNKGDLVAVIEPASAIAELAQLASQRDLLLAKQSRLMATKSGEPNFIALKPTILSISELRGTTSLQGTPADQNLVFGEQELEFKAASQRHESELSALQNQLSTLRSEFEGVTRQIRQSKSRVSLLDLQYESMAPLAQKGYVAKVKLWDLSANRLDASSRLAALESSSDSLVSKMEEVKDRMQTLLSTRVQENSRELTEVLSELASIEERISAARKAVEYSEIRASVAGTLTNLSVHTIGGVVEAGATIAEVVPSSEPLQIEAKIAPNDINSVSLGQSADVVITALNQRLYDPISGKVGYVSADSQLDANTGEPFFTARLTVIPTDRVRDKLQTGMYAQVFIETESRTFMSYMMTPVTDSFRKAFREN